MKWWKCAIAPAMALVLSVGCGGDEVTPASTCTALDKIACKRVLECYTAEELEMFGIESEAQCIQSREDQRRTDTGLDCGQFTETSSNCAETELYNATTANSCVDVIAGLSCEDWRVDSSPGACNEICEPTLAE